MKSTLKLIAVAALSASMMGPAAFAQDHHDDHPDHHDDHHDDRHDGYVRHDEWRKGYRMRPEDWNRGQRIDYRTYHLNAPPRGYEWRSVDGNYVMAAVATGLIASTIVAATAR